MKKGFTLVELLAVIVILGMLIAIISPVVTNLLNDSKDSLSEKQLNMIVEGTRKYLVEHPELYPEGNEIASFSVSNLIENGVFENNKVIDPKTKEQLDGCVVVKYNNQYNQYEYDYVDECP